MNTSLTPKQELELFLVEEGMKPAAEFCFALFEAYPSIHIHPHYEERRHSISEIINDMIEEQINERTTHYTIQEERKRYPQMTEKNIIIHSVPYIRVQAGRNPEALETLREANPGAEKGEALGYPEPAIKGYNKQENGVRRDGAYYVVQLATMEQEGIPIPDWLAYISFIPGTINGSTGTISKQAEAIGTSFQHYTKKNNEGLATKVERSFRTAPLPTTWSIKDNLYYFTIEDKKIEVDL